MLLILAIDIMGGVVVHGARGERASYAPLTWGLASSAEPVKYVTEIAPEYIYIADLDRIMGRGSNDCVITECAELVQKCYVDRGCRTPADFLDSDHIINVIGTETGGDDMSVYNSGFLSVDIKDGRVIPYGRDPVQILRDANTESFDGCIILNLGSVGTESGIDLNSAGRMRNAFKKSLFYGGGVSSEDDLYALKDAGFDGAIISTALHRGNIPPEWIRRGKIC